MEFRITTVTPFVQNCTLLICPKTLKAVLVDPGGDIDKIESMLKSVNAKVEAILVTHGHVDHIAGVAVMQEKLGVPIIGPHKDDKFLIDTVQQHAQNFNLESAQPFVPDRWLEHGDTVTFGDQVLDVLHCPGHSPGHVVYVNKASRLIQMGDVLFKGAIGRTDLAKGDHAALLKSIHEFILPLGDDMAFIPGHGRMSTLGEERLNNPFLQG